MIKTGKEFAAAAEKVAKKCKTLYVLGCFGAPMNATNKARWLKEQSFNRETARKAKITAASADTFGFDCSGFVKGLLWGWDGNASKDYGGAKYQANGVPDISADQLIKDCKDVSTDFSKIQPGEVVWISGHIGIYIGNGLAAECTYRWKDGVQITAVKNIGTKSGYNSRLWTKHTAASGIDAVTHAVEAYVAMLATDYTDGLALQALKNIFKYLPRAYDNGQTDVEAREKMANAATIAGMAFANAFLGVCHSMAHKLGAFHHLPHGVANALLIEEVIRFNACDAPAKMGTFSQYDHPHALERYAEIADALGLGGNNGKEKLENLITAINNLKARVGIKATIKDYGVDEADFLARLDDMVEQAFDDQCTGANPRYPLMSEIKQMYLNSYYGTHFVEQAMPPKDLDEAKVDPIKAPYRKGKKA